MPNVRELNKKSNNKNENDKFQTDEQKIIKNKKLLPNLVRKKRMENVIKDKKLNTKKLVSFVMTYDKVIKIYMYKKRILIIE